MHIEWSQILPVTFERLYYDVALLYSQPHHSLFKYKGQGMEHFSIRR